jgi:anti-sigma B factor antagonist
MSNSEEFKEAVKSQLGPLIIVEVDCTTLKIIDSVGIGALVAIHKIVAARQGVVRLKQVQPFVRRVLELVHLNHLLEVNE